MTGKPRREILNKLLTLNSHKISTKISRRTRVCRLCLCPSFASTLRAHCSVSMDHARARFIEEFEEYFRDLVREYAEYLGTVHLLSPEVWMNFFCSAAAVPHIPGNATVSAFQRRIARLQQTSSCLHFARLLFCTVPYFTMGVR